MFPTWIILRNAIFYFFLTIKKRNTKSLVFIHHFVEAVLSVLSLPHLRLPHIIFYFIVGCNLSQSEHVKFCKYLCICFTVKKKYLKENPFRINSTIFKNNFTWYYVIFHASIIYLKKIKFNIYSTLLFFQVGKERGWITILSRVSL